MNQLDEEQGTCQVLCGEVVMSVFDNELSVMCGGDNTVGNAA